jgi:dihydroxyacetone kinase-like protein
MKKLINTTDSYLAESLAGFVAVHAGLVRLGAHGAFVARARPAGDKVAVISGGGSGHEPLHAGFVGFGMLDAACPGQVFTSPTPDQMLAAAEAAGGGQGILFIVKNYSGDRMNFDMAAEMLADIGAGPVATVVTDDDVAVTDSTWTTGRRGVAGTLVVEKIVGAAAEAGGDLAALATLGAEVNRRTRSMGVALTSCTVPAAGRPTFELGAGDMEMGVGIHGEPGRRRVPLMPARAIAEEMLEAIDADLKAAGLPPGAALVIVNGFGGTPAAELYLMAEMARQGLERRGYGIARWLVGNYVTALDMAGCSLTVTRVDDTLIDLWDAPVRTPALSW